MLDVLRKLYDGEFYVTESLWVKGDTGRYHESRPILDQAFGVVLWSVDSVGTGDYPEDAIDIGGRNIGTAFLMRSADDGLVHQFVMTPGDPDGSVFFWTDYAQFAAPAVARRRVRNARVENGLYIVDTSGSQLHKMSVIGGLWSEENQGYSIPL